MIGIYKITSPSGKVYIGQSWNIEQRRWYYTALKCKNQTKLYNSILKHGWDTHKFEVVHELPADVSQDILNQYESLYIEQYKQCGVEMLNLREPGARGKHSDETRKKMSESRKQDFIDNPAKYEAFLKCQIGRVHSDEDRQKNSLRNSGINNPNYGRKGEAHWHYGKPSPKKGIPMSEEQKVKVIEGTIYLSKPILVYDRDGNFISEYRSARYAAKCLDIGYDAIRKCLQNKTKNNKSYIFKWKCSNISPANT